MYAGCGRMVTVFSGVKTCQRLFDPEFEFDDGHGASSMYTLLMMPMEYTPFANRLLITSGASLASRSIWLRIFR